MSDCQTIEPCHVEDCDGPLEVQELSPKGKIWNYNAESNLAASIRVMGHFKTLLNRRLCQEQGELTPCASNRLKGYWMALYKFPEDCVDQSRFCEWVDMVHNGPCPVGTPTWLQTAIDFVLPGAGVTLSYNRLHLPGECPVIGDQPNATANEILVSGPSSVFQTVSSRRVIPQVECLRPLVFPAFVGVGYLEL